jgi:hypothetical protein
MVLRLLRPTFTSGTNTSPTIAISGVASSAVADSFDQVVTITAPGASATLSIGTVTPVASVATGLSVSSGATASTFSEAVSITPAGRHWSRRLSAPWSEPSALPYRPRQLRRQPDHCLFHYGDTSGRHDHGEPWKRRPDCHRRPAGRNGRHGSGVPRPGCRADSSGCDRGLRARLLRSERNLRHDRGRCGSWHRFVSGISVFCPGCGHRGDGDRELLTVPDGAPAGRDGHPFAWIIHAKRDLWGDRDRRSIKRWLAHIIPLCGAGRGHGRHGSGNILTVRHPGHHRRSRDRGIRIARRRPSHRRCHQTRSRPRPVRSGSRLRRPCLPRLPRRPWARSPQL